MTQYIDKDALTKEIEKLMYTAELEAVVAASEELIDEKVANAKYILCKCILDILGTLEVKEIEENEQPEYSSRETVYRCGKKPRFKVGDVVACYESYADFEREYEYGIVIKVEFDEEEEDRVYTFDRLRRENSIRLERELVSDEAYAK